MPDYDVLIAGGGVAGPVAAKFCARQGLRTLLVEKATVPRHKACSGIQFPYFERILGDPIPRDRLCHNTLSRVEMHFPNGRVLASRFPMLNFMRSTFDEWLCRLAEQHGAEFRDDCRVSAFEETADGVQVRLEAAGGAETVTAGYLVDATGMRSPIRRRLQGDRGYQKGSSGATLNYYFSGDGDLEPDKLYQFWDLEFNNTMFAWVYNKTLEDGRDYWVAGTGYDRDIVARQDRFFEHVKELFHLQNVSVVKREGFSASLSLAGEERIWLGQGRVLLAGDAAGLIDVTRGVGMDSAALSGRLAARAVGLALDSGEPALPVYSRLMKRLVAQTRRNQQRGILSLQTNDELQAYLDRGMLKMGLHMLVQNRLNKLRSAERQVMLP